MTGRYGHTTGVIHNDIRLPDGEVVISELMKKAGYATGYIGKWHLSGNRKNPVDAKSRRGWDFWAVRNCSHAHSDPMYWLNDSRSAVRVPGWEPEVQTDLAVEIIKKNKRGPFSLFLSFGPPHNPYKAPQGYVTMYGGKTLTPRPNARGTGTDTLRQYYAMVTSLDTCVGRISAALSEAGVADNSILVFTSDHGDMLGSQGESLKQRPWEESINIPFIVRYPGTIQAGQRRDWIVSSVDVMPTLLGLCDIPVPSNVQGLDYSATFTGQSKKERDAAFLFNVAAGSGPPLDWRGIRTKEWNCAFNTKGDWVMYDLKNDPYQRKNLVRDPQWSDTRNGLRRQLDALRDELGEALPLRGKGRKRSK
jgi:arylsulfatase A-like enzyme